MSNKAKFTLVHVRTWNELCKAQSTIYSSNWQIVIHKKVLLVLKMCGILVSAHICSVHYGVKEEAFEKRRLELEEMNSARGMCIL